VGLEREFGDDSRPLRRPMIISAPAASQRTSSGDDDGVDEQARLGYLAGSRYVVQIMIRVLLLRGRDEAR
jgi:hypothetical protein